ncbi:MAG: DUF1553 domain-containing protein [Bryobacteraceae bacterium]|nr:DUF1553 domain-containing protein [Bryobacteraceae bacterium]
MKHLAVFLFAILGLAQNPLPKDHPEVKRGRRQQASRLTAEIAGGASAKASPVSRRNFIDEHIFGRMEKDRVPHAPLAGDYEFFRRVHLDLTGRLPKPEETRAFASSSDPDKRDRLIDKLTQSEAYKAKWAYWFSDLAQVNSNRLGTDGRNLFYQYIYDFLHLDRPYNEVVEEILTTRAASNYYIGPASYLVRWVVIGATCTDTVHEDTSDEIAIWSAKHFLGINLQCVSCHDGRGHLEKINPWMATRKREELWKQAAFFGRTRILRRAEVQTTKDEYSIDDKGEGYDARARSVVRVPRNGKGMVEPEFFLTGERPQPGKPLRQEFVRILTSHPQFARATVNMLWAEMMGVGIVDPVDDFDFSRMDPSAKTPEGWPLQPSHPELLDALAKDFANNGYSLRRLFRLIAKSSAYQLSSRFPGEWKDSYAKYYARKFVRRLTSEEMYDSIVGATNMFSPIPVPNRGMYVDYATEARSPEDFRRHKDINFFMESFGQPNRDYSPRTNDGAITQAVLMMNSPMVKEKIRAAPGSYLGGLLAQQPALGDDEIIGRLFLRFLVRPPLEKEMAMARGLLTRNRTGGFEDLQWLLLNKVDFIFNY